MAWESRPVFVSSTFADMQAERDHLRTHVFPALEERLRSRRRHLEWVDLRLGVVAASYQDAEMRELQVLKVCLGEVQRCRPFLIVLLGDRYGWVPPPERIAAAARELGFDETIMGRSVTDLEIQFGILGEKEQQPRSFFYFRDPLPYAAMPPEIAATYADACDTHPDAASRSRRLAALKSEIETKLPERVRHYAASWDSERQSVTGLEAWGQTVLEDIWSELLATTASSATEAEVSWQQTERDALNDYIEDRTRDFIGRGGILSRLLDLASSATQEGTPWGLCLTAPSGAGKSAVFGETHRRLLENKVFVLCHAAAASARAASVNDMLKRWIEELGKALGIEPELADHADADTTEATFHALLSRMAARRRIVMLVDGLDQFETTTRGQFATWLPRVWPANARLIATAVPCEASKELEARAGVTALTLPPLDPSEAREITEAICRRYHRTLEPEVMEALLAKQGGAGPAWGNTLWLVLAVEELNLVDGDDFGRAMRSYAGSIAEQLRALMLDLVADLPSGVLQLYAQSFERAERLLGASLAQAFLGFIGIGRAGWRESDFRGLLPRATGEEWDELRFATLRRLFRGQIRQRGIMGQWDFTHAQIRSAVRQHLAGKSIGETNLHAIAAHHLLLSLSQDDPLRQSETMVHLLGSRDWLLAAEFYGGASLTERELDGATRVLAKAILGSPQSGPASGLDHVLAILRAGGQNPDNRAAAVVGRTAERLQYNLERQLAERGELASRTVLLEAIRKRFEQLITAFPTNAGWRSAISNSYVLMGEVLVDQGNLRAALDSYKASLAIRTRLTEIDPNHTVWLHDLSISHMRVGDVLQGQGNLSAALENYKASHAIFNRLAEADPTDTDRQQDLSISFGQIAGVQKAQGNLGAALESYEVSHAIFDRLARADRNDTQSQMNLGISKQRIGDILVAQGKLEHALRCFRDGSDIISRQAEAEPNNMGRQRELLVAHERIGDVLQAQGKFDSALASYRASLAIGHRLTEVDPDNGRWQVTLSTSHERIGHALQNLGNLAAALESHNACLAIRRRLAQADPTNAEWQSVLTTSHNQIGEVLRAQGNLAAALESYKASIAIRNRLVETDSQKARWQGDLPLSHQRIGQALQAQGNLGAALESYKSALAIGNHLAAADPSNAEWQSGLLVSHNRIGDVLYVQGNLGGALESCKAGVAIGARLAALDPSNAIWQADLSASHERVGRVLLAQGNIAAALESYKATFAIRKRLVEADRENVQWLNDFSISHAQIGEVLQAQGKLAEALESYEASLAIAARLAAADMNNALWQSALSASHERTGRVLHALGNLGRALEHYKASFAIRKRLVEVDGRNAQWLYDLLISHARIGEVLQAQGNLGEALERYKASLAIGRHLVEADIKNAQWQIALAVAQERIGQVLEARHDLGAALEKFTASLAIRTRLAEADPSNSELQHHLSISHEQIGDVLWEQGNLAGALDSCKALFGIRSRLAAADPDNAERQRDLAMSLWRLANVYIRLGVLQGGLDLLRQGRAIIAAQKAGPPADALVADDLARFDVQIAELEQIIPGQAHEDRKRRSRP